MLKLNPLLVEKIWGGGKLSSKKEFTSKIPLGESIEVSRLSNLSSKASDRLLSSFIDERELPYIIKYIDTEDSLSVQVHPNDFFAKQLESAKGKTECWIILEAEDGAGIYLGFKHDVTKEKIEDCIKDNKGLDKLLNYFPVKKGDFFYVPAGTVHAIGKGLLLIEFQQSSGITYRLWDWDRVDDSGKSRELHIEKALSVLNLGNDKNSLDNFNYQEDVFSKNGKNLVVRHEDFQVYSMKYRIGENFTIDTNEFSRYASLLCLSGKMRVVLDEEEIEIISDASYLINWRNKRVISFSVIEDSESVLVF